MGTPKDFTFNVYNKNIVCMMQNSFVAMAGTWLCADVYKSSLGIILKVGVRVPVVTQQ